MFTFIRHISRKERPKSREREKMLVDFNSIVHDAPIREENIKEVTTLTEKEAEMMKDTAPVNPHEYRLFHLIQDAEKSYQEDEEPVTLMLVDRTIYLVRIPGTETTNLDFSRIRWISGRVKDVRFITEAGFDLGDALGHRAHVLDKSLDEKQQEIVRQSLGITQEKSKTLERYGPSEPKLTKMVKVNMDQLLGEEQEEKFFNPNVGYMVMEEDDNLWTRRGKIIERNYELDEAQTEIFTRNLETWMIRKAQNVDETLTNDEDQSLIRLRMKGALEDKTEIYKEWMVAESRILGLKRENQDLKETIHELREQTISYSKDNKDKDELIKSIQIQSENQIMEKEVIIRSLKEQIIQMENQTKAWDEGAGRTISQPTQIRQTSLDTNSISSDIGNQGGLDYSSTSLDTEFYCRGVATESRNRENKIILTKNQTLQDLSKNIIVKGMLEQKKWDTKGELSINEFLAGMQRKAVRMSINSITLAQIALSAISDPVMNSISSEVISKEIIYYTEYNPEMEFFGIQWEELVKILLNYYAEKTSFVTSLLNAFQMQMDSREKAGQLFRVFHNRLRTQLQSAMRRSALRNETQKEMVSFLTLVSLIRRLPPRIVNNYLRQNGTPTIESLLEYCERSSVVAEEQEGMGGPRTKGINMVREKYNNKEDQDNYSRNHEYSELMTEDESTEPSSDEIEHEIGDTELEEMEEIGEMDINIINRYKERKEVKRAEQTIKKYNEQRKEPNKVNNISKPKDQKRYNRAGPSNKKNQPLSACAKCIVNGTKCQCPRCQYCQSFRHLATTLEGCQKATEKNQQKKLETVRCYRCQNTGHFSRNCPEREEENQEN